jgi:GNAT superfamily N-acetyltransferase
MVRMEILGFGPDDTEQLAHYVELTNAVRAADSPWSHPATMKGTERRFRYGWDGEVDLPFLGLSDGVPVATGTLGTSEHDNLHLAWVEVQVHPLRRRQRHGTEMLEHLVAETRARGRTSIGTDGWESEATRGFAARHGLEERSRAIQRRQVLAELDWAAIERLHGEALTAASAYEVVRREGRTPDDELDAVVTLTASINDAPTDDLDIEPEVYTPERVRGYEDAQLAKGHRLFRVLARHGESGELAGHTVVVVDGERPHLAEQHDTSVVGAHRGHRLGLLLKAEMNLWLREAQPQVTDISTWNAESNDFMIGVNEALGYRVLGRQLELQKSL